MTVKLDQIDSPLLLKFSAPGLQYNSSSDVIIISSFHAPRYLKTKYTFHSTITVIVFPFLELTGFSHKIDTKLSIRTSYFSMKNTLSSSRHHIFYLGM